MKQDADGIWLCWFHRWGKWGLKVVNRFPLSRPADEPIDMVIQERQCHRCGIRQRKVLKAR